MNVKEFFKLFDALTEVKLYTLYKSDIRLDLYQLKKKLDKKISNQFKVLFIMNIAMWIVVLGILMYKSSKL